MRKAVFRAATIAALLEISCVSIGSPLASPDLTAGARGPAVSPFTIAVLRRDGVVIPIASYGASGWENRWPEPGRRVDIPIMLGDAPKGWFADKRRVAEWTAWPMGGQARTVHVKSPINLTVECQPQIGLQTDYQSAQPPEPARIQPFPKDGLATSGDIRIEPVTLLDARSPEWAAVSGQVAGQVTATEPGLLKDARIKTVIPEKLQASTPFTLELLFATPDVKPGGTALYFEGVKRYPPQVTLPQGLITYAVGFARIDPTSPPDIKFSSTLADRRREGLIYSLALGSFHMGSRLFWVFQRSAWGFERFDIIEFRADEIVTIFKTPGGVCQ